MYIVNINDINKKEQKNNVGIKNFIKSSFYNEFIHNSICINYIITNILRQKERIWSICI